MIEFMLGMMLGGAMVVAWNKWALPKVEAWLQKWMAK